MAWYEAHQTLGKHPKTLKLARLMKRDRRYVVGMLHDLFAWGLDAARKDGALPGMTEDDIATALDFTGKSGKDAVSALLESGYLEWDGDVFRIHDWYDYAGKLVDSREDAKRRKEEWRERRRNSSGTGTEQFQNGDGTEKKAGRNAPTVPYRTVPDNNIYTHNARAPAREGATGSAPDDFEAFWEAYPRKTGDTRTAYQEYINALIDGADPAALTAAAKELAERTAPEDFRFLPAAEKWLRNKGWLEKPPKDAPKPSAGKNAKYTTGAEYKPPTPTVSPEQIRSLTDRL